MWARGEQWSKCAPFELIRSNYLDARGDKYPDALTKLRKTLGLLAHAAPAPAPSPHRPAPARLVASATLPAARRARAPRQPRLPRRQPQRDARHRPAARHHPRRPVPDGEDKAKDPQARDDETPQHRVDVSTFQIAKYPVTVAEYALAVRAGGVREPPAWRPSEHLIKSGWVDEESTWASQRQHPDHPVVCVSWNDARKYIEWLVNATGQRGWRLPTEAEREKAARWDAQRDVSRMYPWNDQLRQEIAATLARAASRPPARSAPTRPATRGVLGASPVRCGGDGRQCVGVDEQFVRPLPLHSE